MMRVEMTIDDLQQYRRMVNDIRDIDIQIQTIISSCPTTGRESFGGHGTTPGDPTVAKMNRVSRLRNKQKNLMKRIEEIDCWIGELSDQEIAAIISLHYRKGFSWKKVAQIMYGNGNESRPRMKAQRYFEGKTDGRS